MVQNIKTILGCHAAYFVLNGAANLSASGPDKAEQSPTSSGYRANPKALRGSTVVMAGQPDDSCIA